MKNLNGFLAIFVLFTSHSVFAACFSNTSSYDNLLCSSIKNQVACEMISLPCSWVNDSPPAQPLPPPQNDIQPPPSENDYACRMAAYKGCLTGVYIGKTPISAECMSLNQAFARTERLISSGTCSKNTERCSLGAVRGCSNGVFVGGVPVTIQCLTLDQAFNLVDSLKKIGACN